jgi:ABC-type dipeptide/oligopeptide/nickel transport system permease subunit
MPSSIRVSVAEPDAAAIVAGAAAAPARPPRHLLRQLWRRKTAVLGLGLAAVVLGGALLAPWLAPDDPLAMGPRRFAAPSTTAWLGTDQFGPRSPEPAALWRARVHGGGLAAVGLAMVIGGTIGLCAGYFGGRVDLILMRGVDVLMAFPTLLLALAVVATLGGSIRNLVLAVTLAYIPIFSRVIRGSALSVKQNDFVEASRALGSGDWTHHAARRSSQCARAHHRAGRRSTCPPPS